jgi:hypothetical protein
MGRFTTLGGAKNRRGKVFAKTFSVFDENVSVFARNVSVFAENVSVFLRLFRCSRRG